MSFFDFFKKNKPAPVKSVGLDELGYYNGGSPAAYQGGRLKVFDGEKFSGGFGETIFHDVDYWTLRARSEQLFNDNPYARGIIRRLVTNEINTGLSPESSPDEPTLGFAPDTLNDWTERTENAFDLWGKNPQLCDKQQSRTFGKIQQEARRASLVSGDVLVVLTQNPKTKLPNIQLINGASVSTPIGGERNLKAGHKIVYGVELDQDNRQVAYWVHQKDNTHKRLPAFGARSNRRMAWLVYGTDKLLDDVRGQPLLALVLQSIKEIDRYRDSTQRKAVINSMVAMFIKKGEERVGTLPMQGGAIRRGSTKAEDSTESKPRKLNISEFMPGTVFDELQYGEEPVFQGGGGTDENFGVFEETIVRTIAWANEIPPEILQLSFSNNYSASQAAINEFKIYLNKVWSNFGEEFCTPIYIEWMISRALTGKLDAESFLKTWRDPLKQDIFSSWTSVIWYGNIKPSTDILKGVKGSDLLVAGGYSTRAREARINTGTKFSKNVSRLKHENEQLAAALEPILKLKQDYGLQPNEPSVLPTKAVEDIEDYLQAVVDDRDLA